MPLKWQQQYYVDYCATGGLRLEDDGGVVQASQINISQIALELGVSRQTLYNWSRTIPDFQGKVAARQREIYSAGGARSNNIWKALLLKALAGSPKQAEMVLSHFGGYVPPAQKQAEAVGNSLSTLLELAHQRRLESESKAKAAGHVIDGQVVEIPQEAQLVNPT